MAINPHLKMLSFHEKIKEIAEAEWEYFDRGQKKENEEGGWQRVGDYWREGLGINNRDGRDTQHKWSAAFVSWVMKAAGAGDEFKYSSRHSVYIREAIQRRDDSGAPFQGYRLQEIPPQVGDLICFSSGNDRGKIDYETVKNHESHCDIVVAKRPKEIDVIGGNVQASVFKKTLPTNSQGYLLACNPPPYWFVIVKNRLRSSKTSEARSIHYPVIVKSVSSNRSEHCLANSELLARIGYGKGCQIRVKRNENEHALYTVSDTFQDPEFLENTLLMGESARSRLGKTDEFEAIVDIQVSHPSFNDATAKERGEFVERLTDDGSHTGLVVIAPHGGDIEHWADQQAEQVISQLSSKKVSGWCCKGWKQGGRAFKTWHITSTDLHEASFPCLNTIIDRKFTYSIAFHGFSKEKILIGGLASSALKREIQQAIQAVVPQNEISVEIADLSSLLGGSDRRNIVNRLSSNALTPEGNGIQIEQSYKARRYYWQQIANAVVTVYDSKLS